MCFEGVKLELLYINRVVRRLHTERVISVSYANITASFFLNQPAILGIIGIIGIIGSSGNNRQLWEALGIIGSSGNICVEYSLCTIVHTACSFSSAHVLVILPVMATSTGS